jgi:hypothetical protein
MGHSAVTPALVRMASGGAQEYKTKLVGQPGTQGIPVSGTVVDQGRVGQAQMGLGRASDAPDMVYPQRYYVAGLTERPGAGMPISVYSDNLMPVPAVDPRGIPSSQFQPINQRGQRAVNWAPAMPRFS